VDKLEKVPPSTLYGDFGALGVAADRVDALASLLEQGAAAGGSLQALESLLGADAGALEDLRMLLGLAEAYGFRDWLVVDASIVPGLAYPNHVETISKLSDDNFCASRKGQENKSPPVLSKLGRD